MHAVEYRPSYGTKLTPEHGQNQQTGIRGSLCVCVYVCVCGGVVRVTWYSIVPVLLSQLGS